MSAPLWVDDATRTCRVCGCTDDHACEGGCWWVEADLCSSCQAIALAGLAPTVPCKACGAPMAWFDGASGKKIPLDPQPVANGNIRLEQRDGQAIAVYDRAGDGPFYVSHFATCPEATRFRRR